MEISSKVVAELEELLLLRPAFDRQDAQAWLKLAWQMIESNRIEVAIACFIETVRLVPNIVEAWANLGSLYRRLGQFESAIHSFRQAIRYQPNNLGFLQAMAATLRQAGQRQEAKSLCEKALSQDPNSAELHLLFGNLQQELDDFDSAIHHLESGIQSAGRTASNLSCLGIAYFRRGDIERSISLFRESLALDPHYADGHFHLGMALLLCGDYKQGWQEYEWRPGGRKRPFPNSSVPLWDGRPLAMNQTLLLAAEQGFGDTIQFIRLAAVLKARYGCKIVLQSPRPLLPLLSTCNGIDQFISRDDPLPKLDCYLPLASLPSVLRFDPEQSNRTTAYLSADVHRIQTWRERLASQATNFDGRQHLRVGLAWQGDPKFPVDHCRSIPLKYLYSLTNIDNTDWFSLQKGYGSEQLKTMGEASKIIDFGDDLDAVGGAFLDTIAIMQHLDLVITSDTAIAHLAGACGVPVWIGINHVPDWRWNLHRTDSVWYSTARLFRQPQKGDWASVVHQMQTKFAIHSSRFSLPENRV